jgi:hypothetical protein
MPRPAGVGVVLALVVVVSAVSAGVPAPATADGPRSELARQVEADSVQFDITVYRNSSARWTIIYRRSLDNETQVQDFEEFAERFNSQETEAYRDFRNRSRQLTAEASSTTGREMNAMNFSKRAYTEGPPGGEPNQGVVEMSFTWTNFASEEDEQLIVGDVFSGGLYIGPSQELVVRRSEGLVFYDVQPREPASQFEMSNPDSLTESNAVTWEGELSFNSERPRVVFGPPEPESPTPSDGNGTGGPPGEGDAGMLPYLALLVLLVLGGGVALAYRSGRFDDGGAPGPIAGDGSAAAPAEPAIPDEELLSDEDRVLQLLEERGGRMKQVNIVDETGWSKSKVSMLLSDMEDEGQISKLRIGRENVISLSGEEPDAAGSPFDEE